jgi:hypothetical protein
VSISSRLLVSAICLLAPAVARSADTDTVQEYAAKCDMTIGVTVRDFVCDNGTDVPMTNPEQHPLPGGARSNPREALHVRSPQRAQLGVRSRQPVPGAGRQR